MHSIRLLAATSLVAVSLVLLGLAVAQVAVLANGMLTWGPAGWGYERFLLAALKWAAPGVAAALAAFVLVRPIWFERRR